MHKEIVTNNKEPKSRGYFSQWRRPAACPRYLWMPRIKRGRTCQGKLSQHVGEKIVPKQLQKFITCFISQLILVVLLASLCLLLLDSKACYSVLAAGMVSILPQLIFAHYAFKYQGAKFARKIILHFYWGEVLKIFSSVVLFACVFMLININAAVFFAAYLLVSCSAWFLSLIIAR
jgi:ATP synthase protein I